LFFQSEQGGRKTKYSQTVAIQKKPAFRLEKQACGVVKLKMCSAKNFTKSQLCELIDANFLSRRDRINRTLANACTTFQTS
jgi:hypothetical protein